MYRTTYTCSEHGEVDEKNTTAFSITYPHNNIHKGLLICDLCLPRTYRDAEVARTIKAINTGKLVSSRAQWFCDRCDVHISDDRTRDADSTCYRSPFGHEQRFLLCAPCRVIADEAMAAMNLAPVKR